MRKSRVLAMMLVVVMVVATMSTAVFAVEPPSNSKVRVTEKTITQTFEEGKEPWSIWDTQGNFGSYTTDDNVLNIKGGTLPFVALGGFGSDLANVNEMTIEYKTNDKLTLQLRIREIGYSNTYELGATNGEYVKASFSMSDFEGGTLTADELKSFGSKYDSANNQYTSTAMLYISSNDAVVKEMNAYWYSYSAESNQVRKEISENFEDTTWGSWGSWTGGGSTSAPISMSWVAGANENGTGNALVVTGGNTGAGSYAGGQFMIPNGLDLTALDAVKIRYKSTSGINVYFNKTYQINAGDTLPSAEIEDVKGLLGDSYSEYFDSNNKCLQYFKKEIKSNGSNIPSSGGEWTTITIPIAKFGEKAFLKTMKTFIANQSFAPCMQLRFEGCCYGNDTSKYFTMGGFTAVWYDKLPTMSSLEFVNDSNTDDFLDLGTTTVKVKLKNDSSVDINGSVLVAALYNGSEILDMDVKVVNTAALSESALQLLSVDLEGVAEVSDDHKIKVMLWDGTDSMNQITNLAIFDAYGYMEENN